VEAEGPNAAEVADLVAIAAAHPITIADGHHRYETALRYRDERRMSRSCEEDPAFDYLLMLFLETTAEPLTVLATHRIARSMGDDGVARLRERLTELFSVRPASRAELIDTFGSGVGGVGGGRFGLWTRGGGAILEARREMFEPLLPRGGPALRDLDVVLLGAALENLLDIDSAEVASGQRIAYTKSAAEAMTAVDERWADADAAFLLEPTPVRSIEEVAREGDLMPQKSTYFYPKALTGLVINPHEW
jgi:uncharacterized protein (DUF1015 family)